MSFSKLFGVFSSRLSGVCFAKAMGGVKEVKACQKIHFQETFVSNNGKLEMAFDYRIREGEAQSRNAVALMKHIGLELDQG